MKLDEMKTAVCQRLPHIIELYVPTWHLHFPEHIWKEPMQLRWLATKREINWAIEGLQVCYEAEDRLNEHDTDKYLMILTRGDRSSGLAQWVLTHTPYELRLEALCKVLYPEKFI